MEKPISLLAALSFLLFAVTAKPLSSWPHNEPVMDIDNEPLRPGTSYYAVPLTFGAGGGGLSLAIGPNKTCPLDVIQERSDLQNGIPVTFSPASNDHIVYTSIDLNIQSLPPTSSPLCDQPTVWKVKDYDEETGQWFITTNGVEGNPGAQTLMNWFNIQKVGYGAWYKIRHCPSVCESCVSLCSNVGRYVDEDGVRRLALSEQPFTVSFIKAANNDDGGRRLIKEKI